MTTGGTEDRFERLVDRLLSSAESSASTGDWNRVLELASDVLEANPGNERAGSLIERARAGQSLAEGQRAFVTMLFSDLVRSTDLADAREPEIVRDLFRVYRQAVTEAIEALGGCVLQFVGDGVVACFGYPAVFEDDARRAVMAGLGLVERMAAAAPELRERYGVEASVRVGVHTGTVVVTGRTPGPMDSPSIFGVVANLTSRLQSEAPPDTVVISDATKHLVENHFDLDSMGTRTLKGIARPVEVFRVLRPLDVGSLHSATPLHPSALVGRGGPITKLSGYWHEVVSSAREQRPPMTSAVVVRGQAGIGKSRLTEDFCDLVSSDGGTVLRANCSAYHTNVALWPISRMLGYRMGFYPEQSADERIADVERRMRAVGLASEEVLPLVMPLLGLQMEEERSRLEVDPLALRTETLEALVGWLSRFATSNPSVLVVEDLHWADPTTIELLGMLAKETIPGVLILATSREPLNTPWSQLAVDMEIGTLSAGDASELIDTMVQPGDLDEDQRRMVIERGQGVPLFIQELVRSAISSSSTETVPVRLQELLAARLRAPGIDLRIAQLASTLGSVFEEGILRELAEAPVSEALAQLHAAGIVEPVGDARQAGYQFRHVLLRDAAYETQVLDARQDRHARIARLIEATATSPGDLAIVAHHYDLAGDLARSIPAYITAASRAQTEASHTEARRLLDRALDLLLSTPAGEERDLAELNIRLLRTMSVSSLFGYGYSDVYDDYHCAEGICRRHSNRAAIVPAQVGIWSYMLVRGELGMATWFLAPLINAIDSPEIAWFAPEIKSCIGYNSLYAGDLLEAKRLFEEAWDGYMQRPEDERVSAFWPLPNDPLAVTAVALACITALQGDLTASGDWESRAISEAEKIGFPRGPFSLAFVTTYLAWLRMVAGDDEGARTFGQKTLELAEQHRFDYFRAIGYQYVLVPSGETTGTPEDLATSEAAMDMVGHAAFRAAFHGIAARNHFVRGDLKRALDEINEGLSRVEKSGEHVHEPYLLILRAEVTARLSPDRMKDVLADLQAAVQLGISQNSTMLALRAANEIGRLSEEIRPRDWLDVVRATADLLPESSTSNELAVARALLKS